MIPKFRFWYEREDYYPDENYMRHVWGIEYIADNKIELNDDYIFNPYTNVAENIYAKTKIYLMQSTGLKDINGVVIYEGDVVHIYDEEEYRTIDELDNVIIRGGCFTTERYGYDFYNCEGDYLEVVGNIYETPEWLEVHT